MRILSALAGCLALTVLSFGPAVQAEEAPAASPICTDRPGKASAACTADAGHFQVEADIVNGTFQRLDGVTTDTWLVINPTLKYGLGPTLDVEATWSPLMSVRTRSNGQTRTLSGDSDLFFRLKDKVYSQGAVEVALIPYVKAPTARSGVGDGAWEAGLIAPVAIKLPGPWSLNYTGEVDAFKNTSGDGLHPNMSHALNLGYSLPFNLTLSGEVWANYDFDPAGTTTQLSFDLGLAWLMSNDLQLDGGLNAGLNRQTPGAQVYLGLSRRF